MKKKINNFTQFKEKHFIVCPSCGYNNEKERFSKYGTCLRCHKIVDPKIYLKRKLWEAKFRRKLKEEDYYE